MLVLHCAVKKHYYAYHLPYRYIMYNCIQLYNIYVTFKPYQSHVRVRGFVVDEVTCALAREWIEVLGPDNDSNLEVKWASESTKTFWTIVYKRNHLKNCIHKHNTAYLKKHQNTIYRNRMTQLSYQRALQQLYSLRLGTITNQIGSCWIVVVLWHSYPTTPYGFSNHQIMTCFALVCQ